MKAARAGVRDPENRSNKLCCCGGHNANNTKRNLHHHGTATRLLIRKSRQEKLRKIDELSTHLTITNRRNNHGYVNAGAGRGTGR